jgi:hypothetical protein
MGANALRVLTGAWVDQLVHAPAMPTRRDRSIGSSSAGQHGCRLAPGLRVVMYARMSTPSTTFQKGQKPAAATQGAKKVTDGRENACTAQSPHYLSSVWK